MVFLKHKKEKPFAKNTTEVQFWTYLVIFLHLLTIVITSIKTSLLSLLLGFDVLLLNKIKGNEKVMEKKKTSQEFE